MKVLNLRCANGHTFEGWFGSEDDFLAQNDARRIECPLCADSVIVKALSAPRLNLGARSDERPSPPRPGEGAAPSVPMPDRMQALWLRAVRHVLANTEDVGERFADEARRIHHGDAPERGIRGQATPEERESLEAEGIEVAALPIPAALKEPLQ
jgi:hypothetical protein